MIWNVHERGLDVPVSAAGALVDGLAGSDDRLWPASRWPALRLDGPLAVGARGGHGPIRYAVSDLEPGRRVGFRFELASLPGHHWFEVTTRDGRTVLRHVLSARPRGWMRLGWPLAVRWLHDALVEDAFDRAQAGLEGRAWQQRRLCPWVRALRAGSRRAGAASVGPAR